MASSTETTKGPLNCPKGYGLCWTCETWCDMPKSATRTEWPCLYPECAKDQAPGGPCYGRTGQCK